MSSDEKITIEHNVMSEQIVISAALTNKDARKTVLSRLRPETMMDGEHSSMMQALLRADAQELDPTFETLFSLCNGAITRSYYDELVGLKTPTKNLEHHIESVLWDTAKMRAAEGPVSELIKSLRDPSATRERVRALSRQVGLAFDGVGTQHFLNGDRLVASAMKNVRARRQGISCYSFGLVGLDKYPPHHRNRKGDDVGGMPILVPGTAPGKCSLVTAISGGGKSSVVAKAAVGIVRSGRKLLYCPWEMGAADTLELMAVIAVAEKYDPTVTRTKVLAGMLTDAQEALLEKAMNAIKNRVVFVELPFGKQRGIRVTHDEVLDVIHGYVASSGCEVAIFDLFRRAFRRLKEVSDEEEVLYRAQAIAEETQCHMMLVHQQRLKDIELRSNPVPTREGIKGTSAWVDVMDTIIGIYLPGLQKRLARSTVEVHVLKQRFGAWPLAIEYDWDPETVGMTNPRFVEYRPGDASEDKPGHAVDGFLNAK